MTQHQAAKQHVLEVASELKRHRPEVYKRGFGFAKIIDAKAEQGRLHVKLDRKYGQRRAGRWVSARMCYHCDGSGLHSFTCGDCLHCGGAQVEL